MIGWLDFWIWGAHYHHRQGHARRRPRRWRRRRSTSIGVLGNVGGLFWGDWVVYGCLLFGKNFKCILMVETLGKVTVLVDLLTHCFCGLINWSTHWLWSKVEKHVRCWMRWNAIEWSDFFEFVVPDAEAMLRVCRCFFGGWDGDAGRDGVGENWSDQGVFVVGKMASGIDLTGFVWDRLVSQKVRVIHIDRLEILPVDCADIEAPERQPM